MLTELQTRKLTRLFGLYDVKGKGVIEREDYELVAHNTAIALSHQPGSQEYALLHTEYMASWDNLQQLADSDNDNQLTLTEFLNGYESLMADKERFAGVIMGLVKTTLRLQDTNNDGKVSAEEHRAYMNAFNVAPAEIAETFRRLDRDGDGFLTTEEMVLNTEEFFLSDNPQAPGNWLVGSY